jgi:hypothetical protein
MDTFCLLYNVGMSLYTDIGGGSLDRPLDMPSYPTNLPQRNSGREIVVTPVCYYANGLNYGSKR